MPLALSLAAAVLAAAGDLPPEGVDFARDVRPLLARRCFACHGNDEETREAGLRLDVRADAVADRGGFAAIVPGDAGSSELWLRVTDDAFPMPPEHAGEMLDEGERDVLRRWIDGGAPYAEHWSFVPPARPEVPNVPGADHPIDAFVRRALVEQDLTPSPRADELTLLRRLSLDLTGLPPTAEEARAFAASEDPARLERAIDRLLASPAYAERWAAVWLDLARYADSAGHGSDPLRTIWRYRDWVIEAYDRNMPYDEFTVRQLAGDLLPDADRDSRLATAFHRNTMTNTEGGTDDEEFRVLAVKDRVNTTMQVWMGLTAGCAECHSHKYDPISHREYYQLFDVFNQTADADRSDEAPTIPTPTRDQVREHARFESRLDQIREELAALDAELGGVGAEASALLERAEEYDRRFDRSSSVDVEVDEGESAERLGDGSWLVHTSRDTAVRRVTVAAGEHAPTMIGVEALGDASLPKGGPGRNSASGNFVLTNLAVRAAPAHDAEPIPARRVRVELPGRERILSLAEVELLDADGERIDVAGSARQSSTAFGGEAARALDGTTSGDHHAGSVTHTVTESDPWWEVELDTDVPIGGVRLWTRTDGSLASRLHGVRVVLVDAGGEAVWRSAPAPSFAESQVIGPALGEPLLLEAVGATHEQDGFAARLAVDALLSERDGWAIGGGEGADQTAVFRLPDLDRPRALEVTLEHRWGTEHVLGRFAITVAVGGDREPPLLLPAAAREGLANPGDRTPEQERAIRDVLRASDPRVRDLQRDLAELEAQRRALGVVRTPVMEELPADDRRDTHVLVRGNFLQKDEQVHAAVPAAFGSLPDDAPRDRLALARWLVSPENPLTARVAVNRVWARLFGRGLVATEGDFGSQAALPTHPDLLDWLSVEFMESGWDQRSLLRLIVASETYRQSSAVRAEDLERDADGAWLARYPRQRLEAEMVRDTTLSAAGLLSQKRFGPSVFPPQPDGMWQAAFNGQRDWMESEGEDRYRRGLYVFLRRTIPYPMLDTFDAPSREVCTVQRIPTNTPLQAFVTLNDPVFVEAAQALGRELHAMDARVGAEGAVEELLWRVTARPPDEEQVEILTELYGIARSEFMADAEAARAFAEDPLGPLGDDVVVGRAAAWTLVAQTALNMDAVLTKE